MFSWKEFEKLKHILSHMGGAVYKTEWGQHNLTLRPSGLLDWILFLKEDMGFFTLVDIAASERSAGDDFKRELVYHFLNMGTHQRVNIHLGFNSGELIPSISDFFANASWLEQEQRERFDLNFNTLNKPLILSNTTSELPMAIPEVRVNPNKSEAPYPEEKHNWKLFNPLSKTTLGLFEWLVCFDPEKVVDSKIRIGLHHQGIEKLFEKKDILQILQLVDKLKLSSASHYSITWARTVEEMFRIKIPERAQAIRIVMLELGRIADHLTVLQSVCSEASQSEHTLFINAREKIYELFEKFSGHRQGYSVARIGGVKEDLPHGWVIEYQSVADNISKNLRLIQKSLISQTKFRDLLEGEPLNAQSVLQWGVTGPAMRAAGLNFDLRKSQPFYFYQDIDFDIPVGIKGTAYDRFLIRFEEIFQSFRIITQVIDNLPLGEIIPEDFNKNYFELTEVLRSLDKPTDWHFSSLEGSNGETGFFVKLNKDLIPSRLKIKTPSFSIAQGLSLFVKGSTEAQLAVNLASLGISRWEMDR